ncbi:MAG: TlyA family RNA methyltransferase [Thermodesulfobacteriota bacterium]|nr:TlyA family RNA methyltransferase [Thermodesulfobacteriota bacterium]
MRGTKERLDRLMVKRGLVHSRQQALALILAGEVVVNDQRISKAGALVPEDASIRITGSPMPYVSRGGLKLEAALTTFKIDVSGWGCLDVGASTGGFTDCLLQHGAAKVTAVDVGYGQLHWKLRSDPRVRVIERTNIRYLDGKTLGEEADLACIDVSFISLKIVVPAVLRFVKEPCRIISLIKPQFEVGKGSVGKGGVVRDPALRQAVIEEVTRFLEGRGLRRLGLTPSPILGPKGNQEYLAYFKAEPSH